MKCFSLLQRLSVLLLVGASVGVFQSCCDYEDEVANIGNSSGIKVDEIVPGSGKRILEAGDNKYFYTADGFLDYVSLGHGDMQFDFSYNKATCSYEEEDEYSKDSRNIEMKFSFNENRYVSKINLIDIRKYEDKHNDGYYDEIEKISEEYIISYDNEGHLLGMKGKFSTEITKNGETVKYDGSGNTTFTWKNGLLINQKAEEVYDNGDSYTGLITYNYGDNIYPNKYSQFTGFMSGGYGIELFGITGHIGKGPEFLPESISFAGVEKEGDEEYPWEYNESFSYEFNEDGTIYCVKTYGEYEEDNSTDYYTYGTYEDQLNMDESETKSTRSGKRVNRNFLFGKHFMR